MNAPATPCALGYRMPAEWAPHSATWLSWPRRAGVSFRGLYDEVVPVFATMVGALAPHETVNLNIADAAMESQVRVLLRARGLGDDQISSPARPRPAARVRLHEIPTNEPWCRDHGPIFVVRQPSAAAPHSPLAIINWVFNAWGGKYPPFDSDNAVPERIAKLLELPVFNPGIVLEGGSLDVNGAGTLLTTEACLLHPNRNPQLNRAQIEQYLKDYLGVTHILWLGAGIVGDDTDGHVDDLTRFVNPTTVVTAVEPDPQDANYAALQENLRRLRTLRDQDGRPLRVIELPMPGPVEHAGQRLPASYANFYIANNVILLPTYRHPNDVVAQRLLATAFPTRQIVPIDSTDVVWGHGSFHCLTQQQPAPSNPGLLPRAPDGLGKL